MVGCPIVYDRLSHGLRLVIPRQTIPQQVDIQERMTKETPTYHCTISHSRAMTWITSVSSQTKVRDLHVRHIRISNMHERERECVCVWWRASRAG